MSRVLSYFFMPVLIAGLFIGGGVPNLSVTVVILLLALLSLLATAAALGDDKNSPLRLAFIKGKSRIAKIYGRSLMAVFIAIAAYKGFVITSVVILIMWLYQLILVFSMRESQAEKQPTTEST